MLFMAGGVFAAGRGSGEHCGQPDCNANFLDDRCDVSCQNSGIFCSEGLPYNTTCSISPLCGLLPDCNGNDVPDGCDSANCNGQAWCSDCNGNSVLDVCDIAGCAGDPACSDCNTNGVPDGCDIASETSCDMDGDGAPDECAASLNWQWATPCVGGLTLSELAAAWVCEGSWNDPAVWENACTSTPQSPSDHPTIERSRAEKLCVGGPDNGQPCIATCVNGTCTAESHLELFVPTVSVGDTVIRTKSTAGADSAHVVFVAQSPGGSQLTVKSLTLDATNGPVTVQSIVTIVTDPTD